MTQSVAKICVKCGRNVAGEKRVRDPEGRYYCAACFETMKAANMAAIAPTPPPAPPADEDGIFDLAPVAEAPKPPPRPPLGSIGARPLPGRPPSLIAAALTGPACPNCTKNTPAGAKICVGCGIQVPSGRPVITALGRDEESLYGNAETIIRGLAWVMRFGLYPIASEAYGGKKPITTWVIAGLTALCSLLFMFAIRSNPESAALQGLMLWPPAHVMTDAEILREYHAHENNRTWQALRDFGDSVVAARGLTTDEKIVAVYHGLELDHPKAEFHVYQLFTNTLLHDTDSIIGFIMHLGGNMLFLLIFGTRVNALVGNLKMAVLYPVLGGLASGAHLLFTHDVIPVPALGASGAIMGLAGMYLIFFPVHRVYMAAWLKLSWRFPAWVKIWPVRGFWVLAFYLSFDVVATLVRSEDGVAHWAHLGGFIAGMAIAVALLIGRAQDAQGNLLSVMLGRRAWPLIGRPTPMIRGVVVG